MVRVRKVEAAGHVLRGFVVLFEVFQFISRNSGGMIAMVADAASSGVML